MRCKKKLGGICAIVVEDSRSERPAIDRSRINIQPIRALVGNAALNGRVTVDNEPPEIFVT